jgi:HSP20 family protein
MEELMGPEGRFSSYQKKMIPYFSEMNHYFNEFKRFSANLVPTRPGWWSSFAEFMPHVDVYEDENAVEVITEMPGMDEKDVDISWSHDLLTIKGEKKAETKVDRKNYFRMERNFGAFQRSIPIPFDIDKDKIEATFKKGVLTIRMPKNPLTKGGGAKIPIKGQ